MALIHITRNEILAALQQSMEDQEITFKDIVGIWDDAEFIVEDLGKDKARAFAQKILEKCDENPS